VRTFRDIGRVYYVPAVSETSVGRRREFSALVRQYHPPRRCRIGAAGIESRCGEVGLQSPDPVQPSSTWAVREAKPSPEDKAQARMPRAVSRSPPPFRRRRSPSPRYTSRRNRRDRSRSPYSSRRKTRSPPPLWDRSNSPTSRRHRSPPSPRRHRRRRSRSTTSSFVNNSCSPSHGSEQMNLSEKHKMEEEEMKRYPSSSLGTYAYTLPYLHFLLLFPLIFYRQIFTF